MILGTLGGGAAGTMGGPVGGVVGSALGAAEAAARWTSAGADPGLRGRAVRQGLSHDDAVSQATRGGVSESRQCHGALVRLGAV
jgi:hypothetical protein